MKSRVFNSLILLSLTATLVSCNEAGQFSQKVSTAGSISVSSPDSDAEVFCSELKDLDDCQAQKDLCQPAFEDVAEGLDKPYAGCISNPGNIGENSPEIKAPAAPAVVVVDEPIKAPVAPVVVAEPVKAPAAPVVVAEPVKAPVAPVVVAEPVKAPVAAPVVVADPIKEPVKEPAEEEEEAEEVVALNNAGDCSKLDEKYIFSKSKGQIKVKVCHSCGNESHAIVVACPALKAHIKHHDGADYLGACKDE
jgi:hypothetical protein